MTPTQDPLPVAIRATELDDAPALAQLHAAPRVVWGTLQLPHPSVRDWRARLEDPPPGLHSLVACTRDGEVVGALALIVEQRPRRRHVATIGMAVAHHVHGRRVGTALLEAALDLADNWLQVTRVELDVYPDNEAAVALYRRAGFVDEGVARGAVFRAGQPTDLLRMARLRDEVQ